MMLTPAFPFGETHKQENRFQIVIGNEPKNLAGCYGIYDTRNGKWCIGSTSNVRRRRAEHEGDERGRTLLHRAITDGGVECFIYVPLYYFVITRTMLDKLETGMIVSMGSLVPDGYNAYASKADPDFYRNMMTEASKAKAYETRKANGLYNRNVLNTPEAQAKSQEARRRPEAKTRRSASQKKTFSTQDFKIKHAEIMAEIRTRPEVTEKRVASVKASWERRRAKYGPSGHPPKEH